MTKSILIADDDPNILQVLGPVFLQDGFTVDLARNGREAQDYLLKNKYSVALMDVQMPGFNGLEVLSKARREGITMPVFMMSGASTYATMENIVRFGSVTLIEKPFDIPQLLLEVKETLARGSGVSISKDKTILIADDHGATRDMLSIFLQEAGYTVTSVSDGDEAIKAAAQASPSFNIALIDIMMPRVPGEKVVHELKRISPKTLVILLTGEATADRIRVGYKEGAYSLIRKPIDFDVLLYAIGSYEREAEEVTKDIEKKEAIQRLPFYQKGYLWIKGYFTAPSNSPKSRQLKMALFIILAMITGLALTRLIMALQEHYEAAQSRMTDFMNRAEDYMEWDKSHKQKLHEQPRRDR